MGRSADISAGRSADISVDRSADKNADIMTAGLSRGEGGRMKQGRASADISADIAAAMGSNFLRVPSPNHGGELVAPRLVVIHATGSPNALSAVRAFQQPEFRASAHYVVSREGEVWECVPPTLQAWHAGASQWMIPDKDAAGSGTLLVGLNRFSVGIELANAGPVTRPQGDAFYRSAFGEPVAPTDVLEARHPHETERRTWQTFPEAQLRRAEVLCRMLRTFLPTLQEIVGHSDIAPKRKWDPGPAFPMERFRALWGGRDADTGNVGWTTTWLNVREEPHARAALVKGSPLPPQSVVILLGAERGWFLVEAAGLRRTGWVNGNYVRVRGG